jgi:DNA invertase Pin-like site-specific DNA recombinase
MRKNPDLTEEQKIEIVNLWNLGYGVPTISLKMKIFNSPVYRYISSLGLKRTKPEFHVLRTKNNIEYRESKYGSLTPEQQAKAIELWKMGYGGTMIAREFKIHYSVLEKFLKKNNLRRNQREAYEIRKQLLRNLCLTSE